MLKALKDKNGTRLHSKFQSVPRSKHPPFGYKNQLMLCCEIIAICSEILTKHINKLCGQNVPRSKRPYKTHKCTVWAERGCLNIKHGGAIK